MSIAVLYKFGDGEPFTLDKINANFARTLASINSLSGSQLLQLGAPGGDGTVVPVSGGAFLGQVSFPSIIVGPTGGTQHLVVTMGDLATTENVGIVKMAAASADAAAAVSAGYVQAEVQSILTELRDLKTKLRAAGVLDV